MSPAQSPASLAPVCSTAGQPGLQRVRQGGVCKALHLPTRGRNHPCQASPGGIWSLGSWGCPWEERLRGGGLESQGLCQAGLLLEPLHPESNLGTHRQPRSQALQMQLILTCCCTLIVKPVCCQLAKSLPPEGQAEPDGSQTNSSKSFHCPESSYRADKDTGRGGCDVGM